MRPDRPLLRSAGLSVDVAHFGRKEHRPRLERQEGGVLLAFPFDDDPSHAINLLWNEVCRLPDAPSHVVAFGGPRPSSPDLPSRHGSAFLS
ncbi:MAG: hypothetical protein IPN03_11920 [Holophagales bacterium]|nr:hypothetical protein [Holophagales bacterium]